MKTDVAIIGTGAIGLSLAYQLLCRGRQVTIIDRDPLRRPGTSMQGQRLMLRSATSWAASGILPPANFQTATDPLDKLRGFSHSLFPELAGRLHQETGIDCELERCGGWYLADTIGEIGAMAGMVSYWHDLAIECEEVSLEQLVRREPSLEGWVRGQQRAKAWWAPDEYQIRCPLYLDALLAACLKRGAELMDGRKVTGLEESGATVEICLDHEADPALFAHQVAVCGGTWSGLVDPRMRLTTSLVPVRGQILLLKTPKRMFHSVVNIGHRYLVPRRDGALLIGSCEEEAGFQHGTTPAILSDLREFARHLCPGLRDAHEVAAWSGLRPMTFDGFPMCGKLPDSDGIFVAAGHFRSGVHLSPGTAVCLAQLMSGEPPPISMDAFRVGKQQSQSVGHQPTRNPD
ncbi:FAD-binding oxidoreductase [Roseiconus nitratireducens]|uniref:FAD-binding oxidoreductase n=1 Tax=Roseiconus nitratireducens TaxID=2605748 RepID=A0A5M6D9Z3_9BACT|nr:FAD-dependent oxidoreductase [Roseiconus nitratireducens]KAA5544367.1 FAD-binding oxidoreductase [Roseiconus nitratireducens]